MPSKSLALLASQRSHLLVVLSHPRPGREGAFRDWYRNAYSRGITDDVVLSFRCYERHPIDITQGRWPRLPFSYLSLYEVSIDGAEAAGGLIDSIVRVHQDEGSAKPPATWLYYPASERVGRAAKLPSHLTIAFANGIPGQEASFREWYCTRHIRHALNLSALVSGQCFERTQFQRPGAAEASFSTVAIYEQEGSAESIIADFAHIPPGTFDFPTLDLEGSRFSESVYKPV